MLTLKPLVLLIAIANCLHLAEDNTTSKYNASNYLSELESRQAKFRTDLNNIKAKIDTMNRTLSASTLSPN